MNSMSMAHAPWDCERSRSQWLPLPHPVTDDRWPIHDPLSRVSAAQASSIVAVGTGRADAGYVMAMYLLLLGLVLALGCSMCSVLVRIDNSLHARTRDPALFLAHTVAALEMEKVIDKHVDFNTGVALALVSAIQLVEDGNAKAVYQGVLESLSNHWSPSDDNKKGQFLKALWVRCRLGWVQQNEQISNRDCSDLDFTVDQMQWTMELFKCLNDKRAELVNWKFNRAFLPSDLRWSNLVLKDCDLENVTFRTKSESTSQVALSISNCRNFKIATGHSGTVVLKGEGKITFLDQFDVTFGGEVRTKHESSGVTLAATSGAHVRLMSNSAPNAFVLLHKLPTDGGAEFVLTISEPAIDVIKLTHAKLEGQGSMGIRLGSRVKPCEISEATLEGLTVQSGFAKSTAALTLKNCMVGQRQPPSVLIISREVDKLVISGAAGNEYVIGLTGATKVPNEIQRAMQRGEFKGVIVASGDVAKAVEPSGMADTTALNTESQVNEVPAGLSLLVEMRK